MVQQRARGPRGLGRGRGARLDDLLDAFEVLGAQLRVDDLHVVHGVDAVLDVRDVGVLEGAQHVEDAVDGRDVAQERVAQALALRRAPARRERGRRSG